MLYLYVKEKKNFYILQTTKTGRGLQGRQWTYWFSHKLRQLRSGNKARISYPEFFFQIIDLPVLGASGSSFTRVLRSNCSKAFQKLEFPRFTQYLDVQVSGALMIRKRLCTAVGCCDISSSFEWHSQTASKALQKKKKLLFVEISMLRKWHNRTNFKTYQPQTLPEVSKMLTVYSLLFKEGWNQLTVPVYVREGSLHWAEMYLKTTWGYYIYLV